MKKMLLRSVLPCLLILFIGTIGVSSNNADSNDVVGYVKAYYPDRDAGVRLVKTFEPSPPEINYEEGYVVLKATEKDIKELGDKGFIIEEYPNYDMLHNAIYSERQRGGIEGFNCYQTVEETYILAQQLVDIYPDLVELVDIGDSWEKVNGLGGSDILTLVLSNKKTTGDKPKLMLTSVVHAREYTTAPLVVEYAKELLSNYGTNADYTWILDYHEIHWVLIVNPDGRKIAQTGQDWRKNTNNNYCTSWSHGADLNRNFPFRWGGPGASEKECDNTFRGASAGSEPETQAVYNYMKKIFKDYNGNTPDQGAPLDASGLYIDIHSYSELILWPWGDTKDLCPNHTQLQTLGRKFAYWNGYKPQISADLYLTSGTTDDYIYGELGVAGYVFELGTTFFESCFNFKTKIARDNIPALIYAAKVARAPYMLPSGPEVLDVALSGTTLSATLNDSRYNNSNGNEPVQSVSAAEYYIDVPPWETGAKAYPMNASDGTFNDSIEDVSAVVSTAGLGNGRHTIFVRGKDSTGNWGAVSAVFLDLGGVIPTPYPTPPIGEWAPNIYYEVGDLCYYNGQIWRSALEHYANSAWYPGGDGVWFWDLYVEPTATPITVTPTPTETQQPTPTMTPTPTPTATPPQYINIAVDKPVYSLSNFGADYVIENAVDGSETTIWASALSGNSQWMYIDLGAVTDIDGLGFNWFDEYFAKTYQIYLSNDGKTWNKVYTVSGETGGFRKLYGSTSIRYIGILFTVKNSAAYALKEFEVYQKR